MAFHFTITVVEPSKHHKHPGQSVPANADQADHRKLQTNSLSALLSQCQWLYFQKQSYGPMDQLLACYILCRSHVPVRRTEKVKLGCYQSKMTSHHSFASPPRILVAWRDYMNSVLPTSSLSTLQFPSDSYYSLPTLPSPIPARCLRRSSIQDYLHPLLSSLATTISPITSFDTLVSE
jgi:hypothetical protein